MELIQTASAITKANKNEVCQKQLWLAIMFPISAIIALGIDSVFFRNTYFDGRQLINVLAIGYFFLMYYASGNQLRKLMSVMIFLSYIGELIFCKLLGLYAYRTEYIPLYVPFGHAIVYASGYIFAKTSFAVRVEKKLRVIFTISFIAIFLYAGFFLKDTFTLIFGIVFFLLLYRKRWENMYYFIALCVITIELAGTYFKCWTWVPNVFGYLPAANPPLGAVFFYAGGDILLAKIVAIWNKRYLG